MILSNGVSQPIAPQAFAETAPLFFNGFFMPKTGVELETRFATYGQLYLSQPWVATVVDKIAAAIARLGVNVWDTSPATGNILDVSSPYARLMANPCATMDPYGFWLWLASTIEIYGEAFLLKIRDAKGRVTAFVPMHPALTQISRDQYGSIVYRFMGSPNEIFTEDSVVPFRRYNPDMMMRGISRLEPLRSTLLNEDGARRVAATWFKNMGRPSIALKLDGKLDPAGKQRLRDQFTSMHSGASNAGGTLVLENGTEVKPLQLSADEMQYIESRKLNREEVAAVYDVNPTMIGILDHATFSNISETMRAFYRDTMAPRLEFIESIFDWHVGRDFNGAKELKFDVAEVMRGDIETRARAHSQLVQMGIETPNEARPYFDLGLAGPEADRLYVNSAMQPLGAAPDGTPSATPAAISGQPDMSAPQPSSGAVAGNSDVNPDTARKYMRDIAGRVGRGQSLEGAARALLASNPHDEATIAQACAWILERSAA